eukprot:CAMPEP_0119265972 /NCGR_PEP_ID=MMETSP1329-20130426/4620_1 /TAXON_ID=114041 /ORGANISM="Genus nov. species nov., Strain RCC1024" /LENGTH=595 /DNA_ID=CAMNT_0007265833 /DNA_START=180 /DNA_END=1963 /DNA_ORIENTATION=-
MASWFSQSPTAEPTKPENGRGPGRGLSHMNGSARLSRQLTSDPNAEDRDKDETLFAGEKMDETRFVEGCKLLLLCARGDLRRVTKMVKKAPDLVNFRDYDKRTPAHIAASEGHADIVDFLCAEGAFLNRSDRWGGSPLDDALRHRQAEVAALLRARGARLGHVDHTWELISAAAAGSVAEVRDLLGDADVIVDGVDYDHRTALHLASSEDHAGVVDLLLKRGARVNAKDRWDNEPIDGAVPDSEVERLLAAAGGRRKVLKPQLSRVSTSALDNLVDWRDVTLLDKIGGGSFGDVYRATWRSTPVAAKCIQVSGTDVTPAQRQEALDDFIAEASILKKLRHPNVCLLIAYSLAPQHEMILSELMRCSLLDTLKALRAEGETLPRPRAIRFAVELARGMRYLHDCTPPVLHRDLKPANLLLDASNTIRISDFGLATMRTRSTHSEPRKNRPREKNTREGPDSLDLTGATGSFRFMAPEVALYKPYGRPVDVYSFAMILYYMLDSASPWSNLSGQRAARLACKGQRPPVRRDWDAKIVEVLKASWAHEPRERPSFEAILEMIAAADMEMEVPEQDTKLKNVGGSGYLKSPDPSYRPPA